MRSKNSHYAGVYRVEMYADMFVSGLVSVPVLREYKGVPRPCRAASSPLLP